MGFYSGNGVKTSLSIQAILDGDTDIVKVGGPNVSQFGWTTNDLTSVKDILTYVKTAIEAAEIAQNAAEATAADRDRIEQLDGDYQSKLQDIDTKYNTIVELSTEIAAGNAASLAQVAAQAKIEVDKLLGVPDGATQLGTSNGSNVQAELDGLHGDVSDLDLRVSEIAESGQGGAEALASALAGVDGYKLIGRCPDVDTLRTLEPSDSGQKIEVISYHSGWALEMSGPVGGGDFYYDNLDISSPDDGVFVFVTPSGKRWKRVLEGKVYNLSMGGVRPGDDATFVLKFFISKIVNMYKLNTTSSTVPINFGNGSIEVDPGTYIISSTIQLYTVTPLVALGDVTFDARSVTTGPGIFKISNDGLLKENKPKYLTTGPVLNGARGTISIVGDKKVPGIAIGNTTAGQADCRDELVYNVSVTYCTNFIDFNGSFDTYLTVVSKFRGYGCSSNGIIFSQTSFNNSGERMQFNEITLGGCDGNAISIAQSGVMISITNASFDFISGNVINLSPNVGFSMIDIDGGSHAEAFNGFIATSAQASNKITWSGGTILPTSRSRNTLDNYAGRTLFSGRMQSFQLRDVHILSSFPPANSSVYLGEAFDPGSRAQFSVTGLFSTHGWAPSRFDIANAGSDFSSETLGSTLSVASPSLVKFMKPDSVNNWISGVTCTIVDTGDGSNALRLTPITPGLTSNYLAITSVKYLPVSPSKSISRLWAVCQTLNSTLRLRVELSANWFNSDKELIGTTNSGGVTDLVTNSNITTQPGYSPDIAVNGQRKIASLANAQLAPPEAAFMKPVWLISGIDQAININELCTYIT